MFTLPNGNGKKKRNIKYPKYCPCQIFVIIYFASSYPLLFVFILQVSLLPLLHNHNNITSVLPPVHCSISLHCQRLPGSKRHCLEEANLHLARRNSQILLFWSKVVCGGVWVLCVPSNVTLGICNCISICYLGPFQSPNCWSFPVLSLVPVQRTKHGFIPLQWFCQPGFPTQVSSFLTCLISQPMWAPEL